MNYPEEEQKKKLERERERDIENYKSLKVESLFGLGSASVSIKYTWFKILLILASEFHIAGL